MQAADDVELRNCFAIAGGSRLKGFFERHRICAGCVFLAAKGAEAAGGHANIRRIDGAIDVEVRFVAMHPLTHRIRQPANGEDVWGAIQRERVVSIQAFMGEDFVSDGIKPGIVTLKSVALAWVRAGHYLDHTAPKCRKSQWRVGTGFAVYYLAPSR